MADKFYKATQLDGTDFRTGTVKYEIGKLVRLPKNSPTREDSYICGPGVLHASTSAMGTLVGATWPLRLFEVTGTPFCGLSDAHPSKAGFRQLRVEQELPAHLVFGPQGEQVVEILERIERLTKEECEGLDQARDRAWARDRDRARARAWARAWDQAWARDRDRARARARAWDQAWARVRASYACADAASAMVMRDLISPANFDLLYAPWREVIGSPV